MYNKKALDKVHDFGNKTINLIIARILISERIEAYFWHHVVFYAPSVTFVSTRIPLIRKIILKNARNFQHFCTMFQNIRECSRMCQILLHDFFSVAKCH